MFGQESKSSGSTSPISMRFDWKTNKKLLDQIKLNEDNINDKNTTKEEKEFYQKKLDSLKKEKPYHFVGWNKELEQEMIVYPTEFIVLDEVSCIKGRDKANNCAIYSNEIKYFDKEKITAVSAKGGQVYSDFYNPTTKLEFKNRKLNFTKGIIVQEGDMVNEYYISGTALNNWIEGTKDIDTDNYKVKFDGAEMQTNGDINYYVAKWTKGSLITDEEKEVAMVSVDLLNDYYKSKATKQETPVEVDLDDLPDLG